VKTKGGHVYVAACTSLAVLDLATSTVVAQTWTPRATDGKVLVAPAKDVEIVGDVAFVAAGRHGAVAIDVAAPAQPKVLGNCTRPEPSFYASGVRAENGKLYVANGEWGILPIDVAEPAQACTTLTSQAPPVDPGTSCSGEAPWEVLPWEQIWTPPPPAKDPIPVLPAGDRVFAFGDARRIGPRAVDVRTAGMALPLVARYDEPRRLVGIAASGSRIVAIGPRGGLFREEGGALVRTPSDDEATFRAATAVAFTNDGRWVAATNRKVFVEGRPAPLPVANGDVHAITPVGTSSVVLASKTVLEIADVVEGTVRKLSAPTWHLPLSIASGPDGAIWAAAPEWTRAVRLSANGTGLAELAPQGRGGLATTLLGPNARLTIDPETLPKGPVEIRAIARDEAGNASPAASVTVFVR